MSLQWRVKRMLFFGSNDLYFDDTRTRARGASLRGTQLSSYRRPMS